MKDENGEIVEVHCTYDPATRGGDAPDGRKVKATLHWVSAKHAIAAEVRLYDHLFMTPNPDAASDSATPEEEEAESPRATSRGAKSNFLDNLNPNSLEIVTGYIEPSVSSAKPGDKFQFERVGYFCVDTTSTPDKLVFNRTTTLRDSWKKIEKRG